MRFTWLIAAAAVTGCLNPGPGGGGPDDGDPITVEHAGTAGLALESTAITGRGYYELGHDVADATCVTVTSVPDDPDGDQIPTSISITLDCPVDRGNGVSEQITGNITFIDPSPTVPEFRFQAIYNLNSTLYDISSGEVSSGTLSTTIDGALTGSTDFELHVYGSESVLTYEDQQLVDVTKNHDWLIDYVPDQPWNVGLESASGTYDISGDWTLRVDNELVGEATLQTTSLLSGNPACGLGSFDGGTLNAEWNESGTVHDIDVTWSGCNQTTLTLDGQATSFSSSIVPFFSFD